MSSPLSTPLRVALRLAGLLLGMGGVLWWQKRQDERLLREMEVASDE